MKKFILTKTVKGKKFEYKVTDETGKEISSRSSTRDYVACTADGAFYFGRLDLINKGDHGRGIKFVNEALENPEKIMKYNNCENVESCIEYYKKRLQALTEIAYLQE